MAQKHKSTPPRLTSPSVRPPLLRAALSTLPYALLIGAVLATPAYLFKPSETGSNYQLSVLIAIGINTILAVGLNLLMGYAGQVSLGHAAFYGLGAYASAVLTKQLMPGETIVPAETIAPAAVAVASMIAAAAVVAILRLESAKLAACVVGFALPAVLAVKLGFRSPAPYLTAAALIFALWALLRMSVAKLIFAYALGALGGFASVKLLSQSTPDGLSPWLAMLIGVALVSLVSYLMGVHAMRLRGHYLAMATLGFGIIVSIVFIQWDPVTGGTSGISAIPSLSLPAINLHLGHFLNVHRAALPLDNDRAMYYLVWSIVVVVIALSANIVSSRVGRAFRAVHGNETAATTLGVDTGRYKVQVFMLSAALASVAGSLYAHYVTFVGPETFGFKFSIMLVVMVVVGGMASVWGAIFGAGAITVLGQLLTSQKQITVLGSSMPLSDFDVVVFGLILMLIMIYLPAGLVRGVVDSAKLAVRFGRGRKRGAQ